MDIEQQGGLHSAQLMKASYDYILHINLTK